MTHTLTMPNGPTRDKSLRIPYFCILLAFVGQLLMVGCGGSDDGDRVDPGGSAAAPSIGFIIPTTDVEILPGESVEFVADAHDTDGSVAQVELLRDGVSVEVKTVGPYNFGEITFTEKGAYVMTLVVTDNDGLTQDKNRTITVKDLAALHAPEITVPAWSDKVDMLVAETMISTLSVTATDEDGDDLYYEWRKVSGAGTVDFATARRDTTTATFGGAGTYVLEVVISDGPSDSAFKVYSRVTITIRDTPAEPAFWFVSHAQDQVLPPGSILNVVVGISSPADISKVTLNVDGKFTQPVEDGSLSFRPVSGLGYGRHTLTAFGFDSEGDFAGSEEISIYIQPTHLPPVISSATVSLPSKSISDDTDIRLTAIAADPEGEEVTYNWSHVGVGDSVTFNDPTSHISNVQFAEPGIYHLMVAVSDGDLTAKKWVLVTITDDSGNVPPLITAPAAADRQVILAGGESTLSVTATAPGTLSYQWTQISGVTAVELATETAASTNATFPEVGTYEFEVTITDGTFELRSQTTVEVIATPSAKTAWFASPLPGQDVYGPSTTVVIGTWGDAAEIRDARFKIVGYDLAWRTTETVVGTYYFFDVGNLPPAGTQLVLDGQMRAPAGSGLANVNVPEITVNVMEATLPQDLPPVMMYAKASPATIPLTDSTFVDLSVYVIEPEGQPLTYSWTSAGNVAFSAANAANTKATFTAPGTYTMTVAVTGGGVTETETVTVNVTEAVAASPMIISPSPVIISPASAMPAELTLPQNAATLSVVAESADGEDLAFQWTKVSGTGNVDFDDATLGTTTATFAEAGTYQLEVTVSNGESSVTDTVTVVVSGSGN